MSFGLLFVVLTLLLSVLSFYCVEAPLRTQRIGVGQVMGYAALVLAILGTSTSMAKVNKALSPPPLPIEYQRYADPATICHGQIVGDCFKGDLKSDNEVLVLGDSHAAMFNLFFDKLGKELGFKARLIIASSCVTIPGFDYQRIAKWAQEACRNQLTEAQAYIGQAKVIFLAGMWSWQFQGGEFKRIVGDFLKNSTPHGHKYVLSQIPLLKRNPM